MGTDSSYGSEEDAEIDFVSRNAEKTGVSGELDLVRRASQVVTDQMDVELANFRTMSTLMEKEACSSSEGSTGEGQPSKHQSEESRILAKNKRLGEPHWLVFALLLKPCCTIVFGFFGLILLTYIANDSKAFQNNQVLLIDYFDYHEKAMTEYNQLKGSLQYFNWQAFPA